MTTRERAAGALEAKDSVENLLRAYDAYVDEVQRYEEGKGAAPTVGTRAGLAHAKTAKLMTAAQATPLIKKLTIQGKRRVDDNCLLSDNDNDNDTVRLRAREILHIVAENNLAGVIAPIDDQYLEILYKVATKMRTDPSYTSNARHVEEFKRRKSAIKEIVTGQLSGVGG